MRRVILSLVVGALVVTGVLVSARPGRERVNELRSDLAKIMADTGDVMASATYQRFAARREAIGLMRDALLALAAAESAFVADSGRPTTMFLDEKYRFRSHPSNLGPTIQIVRDGWTASISNQNTTMTCRITARLDTVSGRYDAGKPICAGWTPEESLAMARDTAPAFGYTPVPDPPPAPPPGPRKHRDWGPVNNTPPRTPWIVKNVCPGEYCSLGQWAACSTVVARRETRPQSPPAFTLQRGEEFAALSGDVHVDVAGIVVFRHPYSNSGEEGGSPVDSIRFSPTDTLYVLNSLSEGYLVWYYRGRAETGYQFWIGPPFIPGEAGPSDTAIMIRPPQEVWWVRVRNAAGREGWVQYDYRKMARDDRMDERSRCLHAARE